MNLYLRMLLVILKAWFGSPLKPLDTSVIRFRCWPHDLDANMHMNNGRYLTLMDLGRIDLMMCTGMAAPALKRRWMPVIASALVRFRRSLQPFQRFELRSRLLCWDDKWFFIEQRFVRDGRVVMVGLVKGLIRRRGGHVPPGEVLEIVLGEAPASPPMPDHVREWLHAEAQVKVE